MQSDTGYTISFATKDEDTIAKITKIINDAYDATELGDTGTKFKNCHRIVNYDDYGNAFEEQRVFVATDNTTNEILGVIIFSFETSSYDGKKICYFGPFATNVAKQKKGLGAILIAHLESYAKLNGCEFFEITVVNHRTDVLPWYQRLGFVMTDREFDFPHPDRLTRPSIFHLLRKEIL